MSYVGFEPKFGGPTITQFYFQNTLCHKILYTTFFQLFLKLKFYEPML